MTAALPRSPRVGAPRVDISALHRSLYAADIGPFAAPDWLTDAALDPAAFWRGVAPALAAAVPGSSRSTLFERYQLAHDLGARHAAGRAAAFVGHDPAAGFTATSYAGAVAGAAALAGTWRAQGVGPGTPVAIVAPVSGELVTALLAAWHLGAVPVPLPVWGKRYVRDRLDAAAAELVATSRPRALWLDVPDELRLPTAATGAAAPGLAHAYAPDEPALRVFSPLGDAPLAPFDVPAEQLYLGALRDGALFFGLGPGLGVAAPGFCEVQVGLPLLVTCLVTGAHVVALDLDDACQRPELVCGGRVHLLGVRPELRDAMLAAEPGAGGPPRWFRSPATAHDPDAWSRLAATRPFARSVGACYFPSPVAGGAITWSAWRRSPALNTALPAPGLDWQLLDPGHGGALGRDGNGVLTSTAAPAEAIGQPLLGRLAGDSLWVTSIGAHRDGQRLPAVELEALAATRPEVSTAALVDDPRADAVLVVFARPDRLAGDQAARDALAGELAERIAVELAPHLAPPRIEVFTVSPRLGDGGAVDRDWCRGQHVSGRLAAKQREPVFTALARLRAALAE
jgi:hypothetical protein